MTTSVEADVPGCALLTVGVVSDTHGHLYPSVSKALEGVDHIIHAGDVGSPEVLTRLRVLAPVTAVRGNCDLDAWAEVLPAWAELTLGGERILVGHIAGRLPGRLGKAQSDRTGGFAAVVTGHTHMAALERRNGVLYLNPGSAGPGRFGRPRTIARLTIDPAPGGRVDGHSKVDAAIFVVS